jgi:hypothetical protein
LLHVKTAQRREYIKGDIGAALAGAIAELDEEFLLRARGEGLRDGSTAVAAVFAGGRLTVAHVGDSRCVLVGIDDEGHYVSEVVAPNSRSFAPQKHPPVCVRSEAIPPSSLLARLFIFEIPECNLTCEIQECNLTCEIPECNLTCEIPECNLTCEIPECNLTCEIPECNLTCEIQECGLSQRMTSLV